MVYRFDDNANAIAGLIVERMPSGIRRPCIGTAYRRYGCVYAAGGETIA